MKLVECKCWCVWYELTKLKNYNWITLDLCTLQFEYDKFGPLFSFQIGLLGFNFLISFNPSWETEQSRELQKSRDEANTAKYLYKFVKVKNPKWKKKK